MDTQTPSQILNGAYNPDTSPSLCRSLGPPEILLIGVASPEAPKNHTNWDYPDTHYKAPRVINVQ